MAYYSADSGGSRIIDLGSEWQGNIAQHAAPGSITEDNFIVVPTGIGGSVSGGYSDRLPCSGGAWGNIQMVVNYDPSTGNYMIGYPSDRAYCGVLWHTGGGTDKWSTANLSVTIKVLLIV